MYYAHECTSQLSSGTSTQSKVFSRRLAVHDHFAWLRNCEEKKFFNCGILHSCHSTPPSSRCSRLCHFQGQVKKRSGPLVIAVMGIQVDADVVLLDVDFVFLRETHLIFMSQKHQISAEIDGMLSRWRMADTLISHIEGTVCPVTFAKDVLASHYCPFLQMSTFSQRRDCDIRISTSSDKSPIPFRRTLFTGF